jgi:bifunctional non-homologous end joining protein LigD
VTDAPHADEVTITHPERVLFPADGITKADLAAYHRSVAGHLVRHLADRPLMLQRFPEGIDGQGFYQKAVGPGIPDWVHRVEVAKEGGTVVHPIVDDEASLLVLTNLSTVSFHRWSARTSATSDGEGGGVDHPDLLIVDLDPSGDAFDVVRDAARATRDLLDELDLPAYLQVTGSRGIHVVSPLDRTASTEAVGAFARGLARVLAHRHPATLTDEGRKAKRRGRLYVDVARNGWAQTAVAPYSVRPRAGAPVATPITWDELDDPDLRPDGWDITTVPGRLDAVGDPWAGMGRHGRSLRSRWRDLEAMVQATDG